MLSRKRTNIFRRGIGRTRRTRNIRSRKMRNTVEVIENKYNNLCTKAMGNV